MIIIIIDHHLKPTDEVKYVVATGVSVNVYGSSANRGTC